MREEMGKSPIIKLDIVCVGGGLSLQRDNCWGLCLEGKIMHLRKCGQQLVEKKKQIDI